MCPHLRTTESVCLFLDSISLGTVKVKLFDADFKVIEKLIGRKNAVDSCGKNKKKTTEASIRKAETIIFRSYSRYFLFSEPGLKSLKGFFW